MSISGVSKEKYLLNSWKSPLKNGEALLPEHTIACLPQTGEASDKIALILLSVAGDMLLKSQIKC